MKDMREVGRELAIKHLEAALKGSSRQINNQLNALYWKAAHILGSIAYNRHRQDNEPIKDILDGIDADILKEIEEISGSLPDLKQFEDS